MSHSMCVCVVTLSPDNAAELIGSLGGIQDLLVAIRTFENNADVCAACLGALWNLTVNGQWTNYLRESR